MEADLEPYFTPLECKGQKSLEYPNSTNSTPDWLLFHLDNQSKTSTSCYVISMKFHKSIVVQKNIFLLLHNNVTQLL